MGSLPYITRNNFVSDNNKCNMKAGQLYHPSFININKRYLQYSTCLMSSTSMPEDENLHYNSNNNEDTQENGENNRRKVLREKGESLLKERYVMGNELIELRERITHTEKLIKIAIKNKANSHREDIEELKKQVRELRSRDAEFVYGVAVKEMRDASEEHDIKKWRQIALDARSVIPHFNLEGLWVGKYGSHGYEMVNITYVGDNLIAYKVTGDKNVPRGEITFQADLTPTIYQSSKTSSSTSSSSSSSRSANGPDKLEPIQLTETAAKQWGVKQLQRFPGLGHVADVDFSRNQWLDGQFIMIGENYFSFAWVPIGHQIFFGRPSEELILSMMREKVYMTSTPAASTTNTEIDQDSTDISTTDGENEAAADGNAVVKLSELDVGSMRSIAMRSMEETLAIMEEEEVSNNVNQIDFDNMEGCWE